MDNYRKINSIDVLLLKGLPGLTVYDNQLFLNDSVDDKWPKKIKMFPRLPAKMRFTSIFLCVDGEAHVRVSGRDYVIKANDIFMVSLGNIAESIRITEDFKSISVSILPDSSLMQFTHESTRYLRNSLYDPRVLHLSPDESRRMMSFFTTVKTIILYDSDLFKSEALEGAYLMLASYLSAHLKNNEKAPTDITASKWKSNELLRRFLSEVSRQYTTERSVGYYAGKLNTSPKYFAQMIYKESGRHAKDWIRDFVIKDAKTMLLSGNYTVQEISESLNFANQSFFGKYFKEAVGCSPKMFRKKAASCTSEG